MSCTMPGPGFVASNLPTDETKSALEDMCFKTEMGRTNVGAQTHHPTRLSDGDLNGLQFHEATWFGTEEKVVPL